MAKFFRVLLALLCGVALAAMAYAQYAIRLDPNDTQATFLIVVAAAVAGLLLAQGDTRREQWPEPPKSRGTFVRFLEIGVSLFGLILVATGSTFLCLDWQTRQILGWSLVVSGVTLLSIGLRLSDPPRDPGRAWTWSEIGGVLLIVALGTYLRFHNYSIFPDPFGVHAVEEPQTGMGGYLILTQGSRPWEFMLDRYLAALAIYLTGDPSILSIRIPFTIFSALTIIPVYFVLRQLVRKPAAMAGTFLFAVSSWNIIYSRVAHNIFLTNFFVVIVLGLLLHYGRTRRLAGVPWIGLLAGYTLYAYAGYRGTTLFVLIFIAALFLADIRRFTRAATEPAKISAARGVLRDLFAGGLVALLVVAMFAPIFTITTANRAQPWYYFEAANRSLANKQYYTHDVHSFIAQRLERIRETARIFMHKGDGSNTFNEPDEPMLDPLTAVLFLGGLFVAAWFPFRRFNGFLLFMFLALMLGGAVFVQNLDVRRLQGVTPFVAIFAALFVDRLWAYAARAPRRLALITGVPLLAVAGAFALGWNYNVYFNEMAHDKRVRQAFKNYYTSLIEFGRVHGAGRRLLVLTYIHSFFQPSDFYWMIEKTIDGRTLPDLTEILPPNRLPHADKPLTIVIENPNARAAVSHLLKQVYPGLRCTDYVDPDNPYVAVTGCDVPDDARSVPLTMNLEARYWVTDDTGGPPAVERREPFIDYSLTPPACWSDPRPGQSRYCTAEWTGTLDVPLAGSYTFTTEVRDRRTTMEVKIDGQPIGKAPVRLTAGPHTLQARARIIRVGDTGARLKWSPPGGSTEVVPFYSTAPPPPGGAG